MEVMFYIVAAAALMALLYFIAKDIVAVAKDEDGDWE